jgi:hypothetical protein
MPGIGTLHMGEKPYVSTLAADIQSVEFVGGKLRINVILGKDFVGPVRGTAWITGHDDQLVWLGSADHDYGVKSNSPSVWYVTFDISGPEGVPDAPASPAVG